MLIDSENLNVAFALVIAAGLSTAVGAAAVFVPSLVRFANPKSLAGSLGLSAGVMLYVTFVEIFVKSKDEFIEAGHTVGAATVYTTICFFAGVFTMSIIGSLVSAISGGGHLSDQVVSKGERPQGTDDGSDDPNTRSYPMSIDVGSCPCSSTDPEKNLGKINNMARDIEQADGHWEGVSENKDAAGCSEDEGSSRIETVVSASVRGQQVKKKLLMTSLNTGLAIALHNFPEGIATFVGTLDDPRIGATLAVAIAIHNIPEGLCVAMPIYYATGSRWKAFGYGLLSGVTEPLAAVLGWVVLANFFSATAYGITFGIVAGMMVMITVSELLPTARRYDPEDSVTSSFFTCGMGIMALSLVLFAA